MTDRAALDNNIDGVRGGEPGFPVSLVCDDETNRLMLRAINEGGYSCTEIDLLDLVNFLHRLCPSAVNVDELTGAISAFSTRERIG